MAPSPAVVAVAVAQLATTVAEPDANRQAAGDAAPPAAPSRAVRPAGSRSSA